MKLINFIKDKYTDYLIRKACRELKDKRLPFGFSTIEYQKDGIELS